MPEAPITPKTPWRHVLDVLLGRRGSNGCGMMPTSIMRCGFTATMLTIACLGGTPCTAQGSPLDSVVAAAELPDADDVTAAYRAVRTWLDAYTIPLESDAEAAIPIKGAGAVCIVLRRAGRVVAIGSDNREGPFMVRRAAGMAFGKVLADPAIRAVPPELRLQAAASLTLELEVAGTPRPVIGRNLKQISARLEPGLDAVSMRRQQSLGTLFPSELRALGRPTDFTRNVRGLLISLGVHRTDPEEALEQRMIRIYHARTIDLAQRAPDAAPFQTHRGLQVIPDSAVTASAIAELADAIAGHILETRFVTPPDQPFAMVGVMGDYRPALDAFEPLIAPPLEQALTSLALLHYADAPGVNPERAAEARRQGILILNALAILEQGEDDPRDDLRACGTIMYAFDHAFENGAEKPTAELLRLRVDCLGHIIESFRPDRGFVQTQAGTSNEQPLGPHGQALLSGALTRLLGPNPDDLSLARSRLALDVAWSSVSGPKAVSLLPWIGWAEIDYAAASGSPSPKIQALQELRAVLDQAQINTAGGSADVRGGFSLRSSGAVARATAQSLRPAAFLATMLRERSLTDSSTLHRAFGRHLRSIRFLMQLTVNKDGTWSCRRPQRALGGIREAPWTPRQPVAAQALGLMTATETLVSLDSLLRAQANGG